MKVELEGRFSLPLTLKHLRKGAVIRNGIEEGGAEGISQAAVKLW